MKPGVRERCDRPPVAHDCFVESVRGVRFRFEQLAAHRFRQNRPSGAPSRCLGCGLAGGHFLRSRLYFAAK
jgi:hypothetical protein